RGRKRDDLPPDSPPTMELPNETRPSCSAGEKISQQNSTTAHISMKPYPTSSASDATRRDGRSPGRMRAHTPRCTRRHRDQECCSAPTPPATPQSPALQQPRARRLHIRLVRGLAKRA